MPSERETVAPDASEAPAETKTVDDILRSAANSQDARQRAALKLRAAFIADGAEDPKQAITILDGFTAEERKAAYVDTDEWRQRFVVHQVMNALQRHQVKEALAIVDAQPAPTQLSIDVAVGGQLNGSKQKTELAAVINHGRGIVHRNSAQSQAYIGLVRLVLHADPDHALIAMREAMHEIDDWQPGESEKARHQESVSWHGQLATKLFPPFFPTDIKGLDMDALDALGRELCTDTVRLSFQLGLLQMCLNHHFELLRQKHAIPGL